VHAVHAAVIQVFFRGDAQEILEGQFQGTLAYAQLFCNFRDTDFFLNLFREMQCAAKQFAPDAEGSLIPRRLSAECQFAKIVEQVNSCRVDFLRIVQSIGFGLVPVQQVVHSFDQPPPRSAGAGMVMDSLQGVVLATECLLVASGQQYHHVGDSGGMMKSTSVPGAAMARF